jgi:type I site-specific restriction endonuclease
MTTITDTDTCRRYVLLKLYSSIWADDRKSEKSCFSDGRIMVFGEKPTHRQQQRAGQLWKYRRDFTPAVPDAKSIYRNSGDGLRQAKDYAQILGPQFAYVTNCQAIFELAFLPARTSTSKPSSHPMNSGRAFTKVRILHPHFRSGLSLPITLSLTSPLCRQSSPKSSQENYDY